MTVTYAFEKIMQDIRTRILSREWTTSTRLPSSREFAQYYGASVNTVEKAIKELTTEGLLKRDSRRGTYIETGIVSQGMHNHSGLVAAFVIGIENPQWSSALRGIEDVLHTYGFHLLTSSDESNFDKLETLVKGAISKKIDGVIMCPILEHGQEGRNQRICRLIQDSGIKAVFLDRYLYEQNIPYVTSDNAAGAYKLTKQLIDKGHRRILFIRNSNLSTFNERLLGFKQALSDSGIEYSDEWDVLIPTQYEDFGNEFALYSSTFERKMKEINFTAVFTANDQIAEAAIKAFEQLGYKIPQDVSMVTYDSANINLRLKYDLVGATQPFYEMGQLAAKQILNLIEGKDTQVVFGQICKSVINPGSSIASV
ncbi:GntR family transcriptional regulator [Paenibacillus psychroresistens]|uniref:GntR family transcriptional regulator n=1 Tax=Paenibacillus psychroresistens TaxID=1778678 RepID=A0A6B8RDV8_9BACL|nr:GntR family transcriptional regulator [Paenibacillus psychroresistens]QGQ93924.1 GntR family transcriptional regulator [Paenibacillus psychroresistens]